MVAPGFRLDYLLFLFFSFLLDLAEYSFLIMELSILCFWKEPMQSPVNLMMKAR